MKLQLLLARKFNKIKLSVRPHLLLLRMFYRFVGKEIPNLAQIIGIPSIFGSIRNYNDRQALYLAIFVGGLVSAFMVAKNIEHWKANSVEICKYTGIPKKDVYTEWDNLLHIFCMFCGFLTYGVVSNFRHQ